LNKHPVTKVTAKFKIAASRLLLIAIPLFACKMPSVSDPQGSAGNQNSAAPTLRNPDSDIGDILPFPQAPDPSKVFAQLLNRDKGEVFIGGTANAVDVLSGIDRICAQADGMSAPVCGQPGLDGSFKLTLFVSGIPGLAPQLPVDVWTLGPSEKFRLGGADVSGIRKGILVFRTKYPTGIDLQARFGRWLAATVLEDFVRPVLYLVDASQFLAGNPSPDSYKFTELAGVPGGRIDAIQGLGNDLWIGTNAGLYRMRWTPGQPPEFSRFTAGLPSTVITALAPGKDDHLYVGTAGGLSYVSGASTSTPRFENLYEKTASKPGLLSASVVTLASDGDGKVWVGTAFPSDDDGLQRGVTLVSGTSVEQTIFVNDTGGDPLLICKESRTGIASCEDLSPAPSTDLFRGLSMKEIRPDGKGGLWVLTDYCLNHISKKDVSGTEVRTCFFSVHDDGEAFHQSGGRARLGPATSFEPGPGNSVLLNFSAGELVLVVFNSDLTRVESARADPLAGQFHGVSPLLPEGEVGVWVTAERLLFVPWTGLPHFYYRTLEYQDGFIDEDFWKMAWDGRFLWGKSLFTFGRLKLAADDTLNVETFSGIGDSEILPARDDEGGVWLFRGERKTIPSFEGFPAKSLYSCWLQRMGSLRCDSQDSGSGPSDCKIPLPSALCDISGNLVSDSRGEIWYGTTGGHLVHVTPSVSPFTATASVGVGASWAADSLVLFQGTPDAGDTLWIATLENGIIKTTIHNEAGKVSLETTALFPPTGLGSEELRLRSDGRGGVWVLSAGTSVIVHIPSDARDSAALPVLNLGAGVAIRDAVSGAGGELYVGTTASGLARVDLDADGLPRLLGFTTTEDGLPSNMIFSLTLGDQGALWASTERGLVLLPAP
jgi:hypothetical protein